MKGIGNEYYFMCCKFNGAVFYASNSFGVWSWKKTRELATIFTSPDSVIAKQCKHELRRLDKTYIRGFAVIDERK